MQERGVRVEAAGRELRVVDTLSPARFGLIGDREVSVERTSGRRLDFPVDLVVGVEVESLTLETVVRGFVRDSTDTVVHSFDYETDYDGNGQPASIELDTPLKTYLRTPRLEHLRTSRSETRIEFGAPVEVSLGFRSNAERPEAEITVTDDPRDLVDAVGYLGAGMRTTTPERSFATLRGHPPLVRRGSTFSVPDRLRSAPESGIRIEIPTSYRAAYAVAPLAYYLSAAVAPGEEPRIVTGSGFEYPIPGDLTTAVRELLQQIFVLDCFVRSVGTHPIELSWHDDLAAALPASFTPGSLFGMEPDRLLERYLSVAYDTVEPYVPEWHVTAAVAPTPETAPTIPHLVDQLALISPTSPSQISGDEARRAALSTFLDPGRARDGDAGGSVFDSESFVQIAPSESTTALWVGDGIPLGANHGLQSGYANRESHTRTGDEISVRVVCNERSMDTEATVLEEIYGRRPDLPFRIDVRRDVPSGELRELLARDVDFLHYIGHATSAGLECPDGALDVGTLATCGATTFCLNACESYLQGRQLVEKGCIAGIVTLGDIDDRVAHDFGIVAARLLNLGFPLRTAVHIGQRASLLGGAYLTLGDDSVALAETDGIVPYSIHLADPSPLTVFFRTYPTRKRGMGSYISTQLDDVYHLCSGEIGPFHPTAAEFDTFLDIHEAPILRDGAVFWSDEVETADLLET